MGSTCAWRCWQSRLRVRTKSSSALFPILTFDVQDNPSHEALDAAFDVFRQVEKRAGKHVTLTDTTPVRSMPDAKTRRYVAEKQTAKDAAYSARSLGAVIVMNSAVVRGAVTAIGWIKPMKIRHQYVATRLEGLRVCVQWLEAERMEVPETVLKYLRALERDATTPFP